MTPCLPRFPDAATRDCVRALLHRAAYAETAICALLGVSSVIDAQLLAGLSLQRSLLADTPLGLLVRLFLVESEVDRQSAVAALGDAAVAALEAAALLTGDADRVQATARLTPVGELLLASDRRALHSDAFADFVVGPAPVSRVLADLLIRSPAARSLDLGCGCGVLGLQAVAWSQEVVAADINPRAVGYASFNAELNALDGVRCVAGDLFAPLAGQRFDRIVCNPPFVISPASGLVYRDGGTAICRDIIDQAPAHLASGGTLQMLCNWPESAGRDWRELPAQWFADRGCDVWVLRLQHLPAAVYAATWLGQACHGRSIPPAAFDTWMTHLENLGAARIASGLVIMRPANGRRPWLEMREPPPSRGPAGASIERVLRARDCLARAASDAALLELELHCGADTELRSSRRRGTGTWSGPRFELRAVSGFNFAATIDPVLAELLTRLDGRRSLRRVVQDWAGDNGLEAAMFLPQLPAAIRPLLLLGLLEAG